MLADSLAKVLGSQGLALQRATSDQALASARAHKPSLLLLAGDAARDRGVLMRARLEQLDKNDPVPVLVIMPPELGGMATQPLPRHVGYLAPSGGVSECARRVQALVELFGEEGLASCSLQQLADTVSSRTQTTAAGPAKATAALTPTAEPSPAAPKPASPRAPDKATPPRAAQEAAGPKPTAARRAEAAAPAPSGQRSAAAVSGKATRAAAPSSQSIAVAFGNSAGAAPRAPAADSGKAAASAFAGGGTGTGSVRQSPFAKTLLGAPTPGADLLAASEPGPAAREDTGEQLRTTPDRAEAPRRKPAPRAETVDLDMSLALSETPPDTSGAHDAITLAPVPDREREASPRKPPARGATVELDISLTLSDAPPGTPSAHDAITLAPASPEPQLTAADANARPLRNPFAVEAAAPPPLTARAQPPAAEPPALPSLRARPDAAPPALPGARARGTTQADGAGAQLGPDASAAQAPVSAAAEVVPSTQPRIRLEPARAQDAQPRPPLPQAPSTEPRSPLEARPAAPESAPGTQPRVHADAAKPAAEQPVPSTQPRVRLQPARVERPQPAAESGEPSARVSAAKPAPEQPVPNTQPRAKPAAEQPIPNTQPRAKPAAEQPVPSAEPRARLEAARGPLSAEPAAASRAPATQPEAARPRPGLPLESPAWQPPTSQGPARKPTARDILAAPSSMGPAYAERYEASPQLIAAEPARPRRARWPLYLGLAAVSGAAALAYWLYLEPGMLGSGRALGSLQQVPALSAEAPAAPSAPQPAAAPLAAAGSTPVAPAASEPAPGSPAEEASKSPASGVQPAAARGARAADATPPGTPLARAKALIEEGNTLSAQGRLGLAESAYQKALGLVPDYPVAMTALVRVHLARKDGNEALRWAKRLVGRQNDALAQLLLGDALALRGDQGGAREAWEEAAEGGNATARQRLGN